MQGGSDSALARARLTPDTVASLVAGTEHGTAAATGVGELISQVRGDSLLVVIEASAFRCFGDLGSGSRPAEMYS